MFLIQKFLATKLVTVILKKTLVVTLEHLAKRTTNTLDDEIVKVVKDALE